MNMGYTHGAYETLIVCGNYEGNLEAIAEVLNGFQFDQDEDQDRRFVVHDGRIQPDRFDIEGVSASPRHASDDDSEDVSLAELSKTIAPLLTRGTLQLVSIGHYKLKYIQLETLAIHSDVQRQRQEYESVPRDKWHTRSTATYKPPRATRNKLGTINMGENSCGRS
jgi:hypothetical protein